MKWLLRLWLLAVGLAFLLGMLVIVHATQQPGGRPLAPPGQAMARRGVGTPDRVAGMQPKDGLQPEGRLRSY